MFDPLAWGLGLVREAQKFASPGLTLVMKGFSLTGTEYCYLVLLPLLYWCVDKRRALRIGSLVFLSTVLNLRLKLVFAQPRPYDLDPSVALAREPTFGLPSDHAQSAVVLWGSAAPLFRSPWGLVLAIALPLLVGLSRVYLGVHFPTDVLAGWAIGAAILGLDRIAGDRIERFVLGLRERLALALVAAVALAMNFAYIRDTSVSGAFFGFAGGAIYARQVAPFSVSGGPWRRVLRFLFGLATLSIVYALPKLLLASLEAGGPPLVRFLRYALVGAWVAAGAPWLFLRLGLAEREEIHSANENEGSVISK
jgi:membrane-associated phospholipid phosphatase